MLLSATYHVQRELLQNFVLFLGLQLVDVLVRDEEAAVRAPVESVHLRDWEEAQRVRRRNKRHQSGCIHPEEGHAPTSLSDLLRS